MIKADRVCERCHADSVFEVTSKNIRLCLGCYVKAILDGKET